MLREMGIDTGVDVATLVDTARWVEELVGRRLPGRVKDVGALAPTNTDDR